VHRASAEDERFARAFEACTISPETFDHPAHVRLAYVYLCEHDVDAAVGRMREALLQFLAQVGADANKYHATMTRAWILAVAHFMASSTPCTSAAAFMEANPRLLDSKIMLTHYSVELLFSPAARRSFVAARHPVHPGARMT
jgi:hypothetical protein